MTNIKMGEKRRDIIKYLFICIKCMKVHWIPFLIFPFVDKKFILISFQDNIIGGLVIMKTPIKKFLNPKYWFNKKFNQASKNLQKNGYSYIGYFIVQKSKRGMWNKYLLYNFLARFQLLWFTSTKKAVNSYLKFKAKAYCNSRPIIFILNLVYE